MELVKLNIIQFLLNINISIGKRLAFYQAKYLASQEIEKVINKKTFDIRTMTDRLKKLVIHDQEVINNRRSICNECEYRLGTNCLKCGCLIFAKTKISTQRCPVGKWGKEYNFITGKAVNGINTTS